VNKRKILVPLGDKSYEVTLEAGILNNISEELLKIGITKNRKILVISNEEISKLYGEKFLNNLKDNQFQAKMFLIKAGESYKNLKTLSEIYDEAFEFGLDRNSIIIALGGGIVGDVAFDEVSKNAKALTPVPGGVGPMTIACLLKNTIDCFKRSQI